MVKLTKEQEKAIKECDKNILLSAAAGSGKTFVLSKRIINKIISDRTNITDYLLLTFTDNAAKEMKIRIKKEIENELISARKNKDDKLYSHLLDQMTRIEDSDISTIHSFCLKIIRDNITKSNLSPGFTILNEVKNNNLKRNILEEVLDEEFINKSEDFDKLVYLLDSKYNKKNIIDQIIEVYEKLRALADIESKIDYYKNYYSSDTNNIITDLFTNIDIDNLDEKIIKDIKNQKLVTFKLFDIISKFHNIYSLKKLEINKIDFSDMEHIALKILSDNEISMYYKNKYKEILIDEYQDISDIQETIISKISKTNNLFMVGDVKQSIYRFRSAKPELFLEKLNNYKNSSNNMLINLSNNFRSRDEILEGCNSIFEACFKSPISEITYDSDSRFRLTRKNESFTKEYKINNIIINNDTKVTNKPKDNDKSIQAKMIANIINDVVSNKYIIDKKTNKKRKVKFGDIAILCAKRNEFNTIKEVLNDCKIDSVINDDVNYLQEMQIRTIINFLSVLDNPFQDIPLASVLTSPFGDLDVIELAKIKIGHIDKTLYNACIDYIKNNNDILKDKLNSFFTLVDRYRKDSKTTPIYLLLMNLLEESGYIYYLKGLSNSEFHLANVDMLIEQAYEFENDATLDIHSFINYIEYIDKYSVKEKTTDNTNIDINKVKITTIHSSKGMEYPVVILPFLEKKFSNDNGNKKCSYEYNEKLGIAFKNIDYLTKIKEDSPIYKRIEECNKKEEKEEKLRLLYVAITRAREFLYLISSRKSIADEKDNNWKDCYDGSKRQFNDEYLESINSYMDIICPIALDDSNSNIFENKFLTYSMINEMNLKIKDEDNSNKPKFDIISKEENNEIDISLEKKLKENEEFIYKYKYLNQIDNKLSVSQIKKDSVNINNKRLKTFSNEKSSSGLQSGLVYHKVLEKINYKKINNNVTLDDITKEIDEINSNGFISDDERKIIDDKCIYNMFTLDIGKKIISAARIDKIYREQKFMISISANDYYKNEDLNEQIIIQGIIDLFIEEDDGIILIDYKSDKSNDKSYYIDNYSIQLEYYQKALEQILDKKVKEKYIYSFTIGEFIAC